MTRIILDTIDNKTYPINRKDDKPVEGLSPHLVVLEVITEPQPDPGEGFSIRRAEPVDDLLAGTRTIGWIVEELPATIQEPDFQLFLDLILTSNIYQSIVGQSTQSPAVGTGLTVTMGALLLAAGGNPNIPGMQAGMNLLFSVLQYTTDDLVELNDILVLCKLVDSITIPTS